MIHADAAHQRRALPRTSRLKRLPRLAVKSVRIAHAPEAPAASARSPQRSRCSPPLHPAGTLRTLTTRVFQLSTGFRLSAALRRQLRARRAQIAAQRRRAPAPAAASPSCPRAAIVRNLRHLAIEQRRRTAHAQPLRCDFRRASFAAAICVSASSSTAIWSLRRATVRLVGSVQMSDHALQTQRRSCAETRQNRRQGFGMLTPCRLMPVSISR